MASFSVSQGVRRCTRTWGISAGIRFAGPGIAVLPALLLNYAGQTALLIAKGTAEGNPFFELVPQWAIYPFVVLATLATIIASQAIITGSFSMTRQATQLGWLPGATDSSDIGQGIRPDLCTNGELGNTRKSPG